MVDHDRECDVPGCIAPASDKHHVTSYDESAEKKNFLHLCRGDDENIPNHHDSAHQGDSDIGLVLWRKLPPNHRAEVPKIGTQDLGMYKRKLRVDQQVEVAFTEAREHFDEEMASWSSGDGVDLGHPHIGGIRQSASVVGQLTSSLNAEELRDDVHEHRTRPVQVHLDGRTAKVYVLPVYASSDFQNRLAAVSAFREKFRKEQTVDRCGKIVTNDGLLSDHQLADVLER